VFVVTGGGSGIGRALAHSLALRGKEVLVIGRRHEPLVETAAFSPLISLLCADVASTKGRSIIMEHLKKTPEITGLINNAGTIEPIISLDRISEEDWQQALAINLTAPLFLSQQLLDKLTDGRVLNMGSATAYLPIEAWASYCVSKSALSMLTRCWQLESKKTAFASVMPGIIDTNMQLIIRESENGSEKDRTFYKTLQRENRLVKTEVAAAFLTWLLLDISVKEYTSKEWDIYDASHHPAWLVSPHIVPHWDI